MGQHRPHGIDDIKSLAPGRCGSKFEIYYHISQGLMI